MERRKIYVITYNYYCEPEQILRWCDTAESAIKLVEELEKQYGWTERCAWFFDIEAVVEANPGEIISSKEWLL